MTFGIVFSSIISGLSVAVWALLQGYSIPAALLLHALAGTAGAVLFIGFAVLRPAQGDGMAIARHGQRLN